jgi:hypothetical protein
MERGGSGGRRRDRSDRSEGQHRASTWPECYPQACVETVPHFPPGSLRSERHVEAKVAVTLFVPFMTTVHAPVPEHAPPHPVKVEPDAARARSLTVVPPP